MHAPSLAADARPAIVWRVRITPRPRPARSHAVLIAAAGLTTLLAAGETAAQPADDATRIRAARAQSNAAIAAHDIDGIARHWMSDIHIVTSTSAQGRGRDVNARRMAEQFARRPDTVYVRTPTAIEVWTAWEVAAERGEWTGRWSEPDGTVEIRGTYLAQWRRIDGTWRIQAELFVPTQCSGSAYCTARP
jgi:ketosteroid isomerase-like protein